MSSSQAPSYYVGRTGREAWDEIEEYKLNYNRGCAWKYLVRAGRKTSDPRDDLRKAIACIEREIEVFEQTTGAVTAHPTGASGGAVNGLIPQPGGKATVAAAAPNAGGTVATERAEGSGRATSSPAPQRVLQTEATTEVDHG